MSAARHTASVATCVVVAGAAAVQAHAAAVHAADFASGSAELDTVTYARIADAAAVLARYPA